MLAPPAAALASGSMSLRRSSAIALDVDAAAGLRASGISVSAGRAERNVADDYLKRRGWKEESAGTRA